MKDSDLTFTESVYNATLQKKDLLVNQYIQFRYPEFNPTKIKVLTSINFIHFFTPYSHRYWEALGRDTREISKHPSPLFLNSNGFTTPAPKEERQSFVTSSAIMEVYVHETLHLLQSDKIFAIYFNCVLNAYLIEGVTQYFTRDLITREKFTLTTYAEYLSVIDYAIEKAIITEENLKNFNFKGEISTEITHLYKLFLVRFTPEIIINICSYLLTFNKDNIDVRFINFMKNVIEGDKKILEKVIEYLSDPNESTIKTEFISHLTRLIYSNDLLNNLELSTNSTKVLISLLKEINPINDERLYSDNTSLAIQCIRYFKEYQKSCVENNSQLKENYEKEILALNLLEFLENVLNEEKLNQTQIGGIFTSISPIQNTINEIIKESLKLFRDSDFSHLMEITTKTVNTLLLLTNNKLKNGLKKYSDFLNTNTFGKKNKTQIRKKLTFSQ